MESSYRATVTVCSRGVQQLLAQVKGTLLHWAGHHDTMTHKTNETILKEQALSFTSIQAKAQPLGVKACAY